MNDRKDKIMDKITESIEKINDILAKGTRVPFSKQLLVDADAIAEILDNLELNMPRIYDEANNVIAEKNRILNDAKREAEDIVSRATTQRKQILEETDVMKEAHQRAQTVTYNAQAEASNTRTEANLYVDRRLTALEDNLARNLAEVKALKTRLAEEDAKVAEQAKLRAAARAAAQQKAAQQKAAQAQQAQAQGAAAKK